MVQEKLIFDGEHIRATAFEVAGAQRLVALFGHRRQQPGFPTAEPAAFVMRRGCSQIRIHVCKNDFYLNDDLLAARRAIRRYAARFSDVSGMGFSMGGFGCLVFARALQLHRALLISPQRPLFPQKRCPGLLDRQTEAAFFSFSGGRFAGLAAQLQGVVLFDPWFAQGRDRAYARILADMMPGLSLVAMPGGGHPASAMLTRLDRYYQLQQAFLRPDFNAMDFRSIHRRTRSLDLHYMHSIADRLSRQSISQTWRDEAGSDGYGADGYGADGYGEAA